MKKIYDTKTELEYIFSEKEKEAFIMMDMKNIKETDKVIVYQFTDKDVSDIKMIRVKKELTKEELLEYKIYESNPEGACGMYFANNTSGESSLKLIQNLYNYDKEKAYKIHNDYIKACMFDEFIDKVQFINNFNKVIQTLESSLKELNTTVKIKSLDKMSEDELEAKVKEIKNNPIIKNKQNEVEIKNVNIYKLQNNYIINDYGHDTLYFIKETENGYKIYQDNNRIDDTDYSEYKKDLIEELNCNHIEKFLFIEKSLNETNIITKIENNKIVGMSCETETIYNIINELNKSLNNELTTNEAIEIEFFDDEDDIKIIRRKI